LKAKKEADGEVKHTEVKHTEVKHTEVSDVKVHLVAADVEEDKIEMLFLFYIINNNNIK
jgi:hypothetical protein